MLYIFYYKILLVNVLTSGCHLFLLYFIETIQLSFLKVDMLLFLCLWSYYRKSVNIEEWLKSLLVQKIPAASPVKNFRIDKTQVILRRKLKLL